MSPTSPSVTTAPTSPSKSTVTSPSPSLTLLTSSRVNQDNKCCLLFNNLLWLYNKNFPHNITFYNITLWPWFYTSCVSEYSIGLTWQGHHPIGASHHASDMMHQQVCASLSFINLTLCINLRASWCVQVPCTDVLRETPFIIIITLRLLLGLIMTYLRLIKYSLLQKSFTIQKRYKRIIETTGN